MNLFYKKSSAGRPAQSAPVKLLKQRPALPYEHAHALLLDELRWLNRLLAAHVLRLRRVDFYDRVKSFRDVFIADEEIDALLMAGIFEADSLRSDDERGKHMAKLMQQAQDLRQEIGRRVQEALTRNVHLPLVHLARSFHLSEFEQQALVICLAPLIDARYEKLYAYLQNDVAKKFPSVDLILGLLSPGPEERLRLLPHFSSGSRLRHYGLLESAESEAGTSAAQHFLRADARIVQYVLGNQAPDPRVLPHLCFFPPLPWKNIVVPAALQHRLQKLLQTHLNDATGQRPILYLYGRSGVGKMTVARTLCGEAGVGLAVVDVRSLLRAPENFVEKIRLILREGLLQPCAVYFDHLEKLENADGENITHLTMLMQELRELSWLTFLGSENPLPAELLDLATIYAIEIPAPDYAAQKKLWEIHLDGILAENDWPHLDELTARFDLTGGQIARAVRRAQQAALVRDPEQGQVTLDDLLASSRVQSQPKLVALARKIEPKYRWSELVLPEDQMTQLRELANQVKHRQTVMGEWGFGNKLALGRGLAALFAGPSGTGKTMAAEVIANDLGLDLYKIDLSAVVSKYIGETEKNLNRIFTEAEHSNAILFFDEADALFGKRSEVRDSHDRYANIEIAYLLQKMEEYEGITILATNLRQNLDEAFTRRIRFIVEFPFPNEEYRRRIWQGIWPKATLVAPEVDFNFIARQFKLTGGNIRNIALAAAFLAAENGQMVTMKHLLQATRREFQKMGKVINESEFAQVGMC
ncbi:MAG: AAA family ATPase [candidate division KSB1 bacterium]|nr:AAA family ATPase [candidate division KSB1 bacterium]